MTSNKCSNSSRKCCHLQLCYGPHFLNSCRYQSSTFSCAVDCFLEVADSIFMPYLKNIPRTNIVQLIFDSCSLYDNIIYQETFSTAASLFYMTLENHFGHISEHSANPSCPWIAMHSFLKYFS